MLYLAYAPLDILPPAFRKQFAFDLILSALIGEGIYLFGDLVRLSLPVCRSLLVVVNMSLSMSVSALVSISLAETERAQLAQPILRTLESTDVEWIVQILRAFNAGNIKEWKALGAKYAAQLDAQVLLSVRVRVCVHIDVSPALLLLRVLRPLLLLLLLARPLRRAVS